MMSFYDLAPAGRTGLILLFYVTFCLGVCLAFMTYQKNSFLSKALILSFGVLNLSVMLLYAAEVRSTRLDKIPSEISKAFCECFVIFPVLLLVISLAYYAFIIYKEIKYRKKNLTRSAVREAIDKISSGLCYYYENGRVVLMNNRMNELCYAITGKDLQNASLFWDDLTRGKDFENAKKLRDGDTPAFRLKDNTVWSFSREDIGGIIQLVAGEITQLQAVTDELWEKNERLESLNVRLRQYGENIDELARSKERLEIKVRIHRELGQTLLASRRYLIDDLGVLEVPLEQWQKNIAMLRKEAEIPYDENPMAMLVRAAEATGVGLSVEGKLPQVEWIQRLFVQSAAEALTNAISHAAAKTLYISFSEDEESYTVRLCNDGVRPTEKIVEGGGLGSLRKRVESASGEMVVSHAPEFALTVTLPKERGDLL